MKKLVKMREIGLRRYQSKNVKDGFSFLRTRLVLPSEFARQRLAN